MQDQAESYGCIPEMRNAIAAFFSPNAEYPRCSKCGRPYQVLDMANDDEIFVGCPNIGHVDDDMKYGRGARNYDHEVESWNYENN